MVSFNPAPQPLVAVEPVPRKRLTVYDLFRDYRQFFAAIPGEVSQFEESDFGYEWRCEFDLGSCLDASGERYQQLHFSLIDLDGQQAPAAALCLVETTLSKDILSRELLPLLDVHDTHEQMNEQLTAANATVEMLGRAFRFVEAMAELKAQLDGDVIWA